MEQSKSAFDDDNYALSKNEGNYSQSITTLKRGKYMKCF